MDATEIKKCSNLLKWWNISPLLRWLTGELTSGNKVECFVDVINTPTYAENLAEMIEIIIQRGLIDISHPVGRTRINRFEFFQSCAHIFGLNVDLLVPVQAGERGTRILLQPDVSLSIEQASAILGVNFNSVHEGFSRLKMIGGI